MADNETFAAVPRSVQLGAVHTADIVEPIEEAAKQLPAFDPNNPDPPEGDDVYGEQIRKAFAIPLVQIRALAEEFAKAIQHNAQMVEDSGVAFEGASEDNLDAIRVDGGRRV